MTSLPATTKALMAISDLMRQNWMYLLAGIAVTGLALRQWLVSDSGRARIDHLQLHVPGIRDVSFRSIWCSACRS